MNNLIKIGLPILVAVLIIFAAVAVTLTVTASDQSSRVAAATNNIQDGNSQQLNCSGDCGNCTDNSNCNGYGNCNGRGYGKGNQGSCCDNSNAGAYVPKTNGGRGCCSGR